MARKRSILEATSWIVTVQQDA